MFRSGTVSTATMIHLVVVGLFILPELGLMQPCGMFSFRFKVFIRSTSLTVISAHRTYPGGKVACVVAVVWFRLAQLSLPETGYRRAGSYITRRSCRAFEYKRGPVFVFNVEYMPSSFLL